MAPKRVSLGNCHPSFIQLCRFLTIAQRGTTMTRTILCANGNPLQNLCAIFRCFRTTQIHMIHTDTTQKNSTLPQEPWQPDVSARPPPESRANGHDGEGERIAKTSRIWNLSVLELFSIRHSAFDRTGQLRFFKVKMRPEHVSSKCFG